MKKKTPPKLVRVQHWPTILADLVHLRMHSPFVWGQNDCCLFACDMIKAMTGVDFAEKMRGKYKDALGAARQVKKYGRNLEALATAFCKSHGMVKLTHVAYARRGDLVLFNTPDHGPSFGVCLGAIAAFTGVNGLVFHPISACTKAWRI